MDSYEGKRARQQAMLAAAIEYANQGLYIFPVPPTGKGGCISSDPNKKSYRHYNGRPWSMTRDPGEIEKYWRLWPNANIGMPTGCESGSHAKGDYFRHDNGFFAIELDVADGKKGHESFARLEVEVEPLPPTRMQRTASGSEHRLLKHPGIKVWTSASKIALDVDVRGDGGQILVPPSFDHKRGRPREWINDLPLATCPEAWLPLLTKSWAALGGARSTGKKSVAPQASCLIIPAWLNDKAKLHAGCGIVDPNTLKCSLPVNLAEIKAMLCALIEAAPKLDGRRIPYDDWRDVGGGLKNDIGAEALPWFVAFSRHREHAGSFSGQRAEVFAVNFWNQMGAGMSHYGIGSLYHVAEKYAPEWRDFIGLEP